MKKTFVEPEQSVILLRNTDVICTSGAPGDDPGNTTTCANPVPIPGMDELGEMGM